MFLLYSGRSLFGDVDGYDCVVRTEDGDAVGAHRALLCAASPFFRAMFSAEHGSRRDVLLRGVSAPVLNALFSCIYSKELLLSNANVLDVLEAADMLLLDVARKKRFAYLLRNIDPGNCFSLATVALRYHCPDFKNAVVAYLKLHFDTAWTRCREFLDMPVAFLQELLSSDELNVHHEDDLLHAIHRWHMRVPPVNDGVMLGLLSCVRVGLCGRAALDKARKRLPALAQSPAFRQAIDDALERGPCSCPSGERLPPADSCRDCGGSGPQRWLPRLPHEVLLVVGDSFGADHGIDMEVYDYRAKKWELHRHTFPSPRTHYGLALCGKHLYLFGGMGRDTYLESVLRFDTERGVWEERSPMRVARAKVGVVVLNGDVYVIGGITATGATATVERYSPPCNKWTPVACLKRKRAAAAACAFNGRLYVSGGLDVHGALFSVEEYVPLAVAGQWRLICPLPSPRHSHQMVFHDGYVYVIGGTDGLRDLRSVQRSKLNCVQDWHDVSPMRVIRGSVAVAELNGDLYAFGYIGTTSIMADVERYAPAKGHWHKVEPLKQPLRFASAFTVKGLPGAKWFLSYTK